MADNDDHIRLHAEEARAGQKTGSMRWVLGISLALIVAIFAALLLL